MPLKSLHPTKRHSFIARSVLLVLGLYPACAFAWPSIFAASTLGGDQWDTVRSITTDAAQNIYIVGETYSANFPGARSGPCGAGDAFLVKLNAAGTSILFSVVFGGTGYESARGVAVDANGNIYVTGTSTSPNFPTSGVGFLRGNSANGQSHAFVTAFSSSGRLNYSVLLGGSSTEAAYAVAVDAAGFAYIAGTTQSSDFPTTSNAFQSAFAGNGDCFVAKIDPSGSNLLYSTYLGGGNLDVCRSIAIDANGAAFVTGTTLSTAFPVSSALKATLSGTSDAFLTKLGPNGDKLLFSTFLGGEDIDDGNVVRLDANGIVYLGGDTTSIQFPATGGVVQKNNAGTYDGFVCAFTNDGSSIVFCSYYGGSGTESVNDLYVAPDGNIVITGHTSSPDLPILSPLQSTLGGGFDAFAAILRPGASALLSATFLGGAGDDRAYAVAAVGQGRFVFGGQMFAGSTPLVPGSLTRTPAGQYDGFFVGFSYLHSLSFNPLPPCRVVDTRGGTGPLGGPTIVAGIVRTFLLTGSCGLPATAQAFSLNVTVVPRDALGYLTIWPTGQPQPTVSLLNSDGRVKANAAIVSAGTSGAVNVFATNTTDVVIDVDGYFDAPSGSSLLFFPSTPCRVADTRFAVGVLGGPRLTAGQNRSFPVASAPCSIQPNSQAYSLNFTAIPAAALGYLTIWPDGQTRPLVSTLNDLTGTIVANASLVPAGNGGAIDVYASDDTNLAVDLNGTFASSGQNGLSLYTTTPCRIYDSRLQPFPQPILGSLNVTLFGGACGIPAVAQVFVLNVTAVPVGVLSYLTIWPAGQVQPQVSTLNALDGAIISNLAIVPASSGTISLFTTNPAHIILDVFAYFAP